MHVYLCVCVCVWPAEEAAPPQSDGRVVGRRREGGESGLFIERQQFFNLYCFCLKQVIFPCKVCGGSSTGRHSNAQAMFESTGFNNVTFPIDCGRCLFFVCVCVGRERERKRERASKRCETYYYGGGKGGVVNY